MGLPSSMQKIVALGKQGLHGILGIFPVMALYSMQVEACKTLLVTLL